MANINDFKSRLKGGGARANQFKVTLIFPLVTQQLVEKQQTLVLYVTQHQYLDKILELLL